ncbi:hypothetical protein [Novacetimonas hansenii]|uniref:hypothetical protein n=1 Tax=Novacetimonas hansenii TaxID=436 RepID=UPI0039EB11E4
MKITVFHGTSEPHAAKIAAGGIDVTLGGGELGRGFYTGEFLYEARAWAFQTNAEGNARVVEFEIDDSDFFATEPLSLTASQAMAYRNNIRLANTTRTYLFDRNVVWSEIVGSDRVKGDQYKWESSTAETLINGPNVTRTVRK